MEDAPGKMERARAARRAQVAAAVAKKQQDEEAQAALRATRKKPQSLAIDLQGQEQHKNNTVVFDGADTAASSAAASILKGAGEGAHPHVHPARRAVANPTPAHHTQEDAAPHSPPVQANANAQPRGSERPADAAASERMAGGCEDDTVLDYLQHQQALFASTRDAITRLELDTTQHLVDIGLSTKHRDRHQQHFSGLCPAHVIVNTHNSDGFETIKATHDFVTVKAKHDFEALESDELSFKQGDEILVTSRRNASWWEGVVVIQPDLTDTQTNERPEREAVARKEAASKPAALFPVNYAGIQVDPAAFTTELHQRIEKAANVHELHQQLADPDARGSRTLCIMTADAGTGKTNFSRQLMHIACSAGLNEGGSYYVPFFVPMQRLARLSGSGVDQGCPAEGSSANPLFKYIQAVYSTSDDERVVRHGSMLVAAHKAGRLFPIIDGLDEAPDLRDDLVAAIIRDCLHLQGRKLFRCLLTTRPEGMGDVLAEFIRAPPVPRKESGGQGRASVFVHNLQPLTMEQQQSILRAQLPDTGEKSSGHFVTQLFKYIASRTRFDELTSMLDQDDIAQLRKIPGFDETKDGATVQVISQAASSAEPAGLRPVQTADELIAVATASQTTIRRVFQGVAAQLDLPVVSSVDELQGVPDHAGFVIAPFKKRERILEKMGESKAEAIFDVVRATAAVKDAKGMRVIYNALNRPGHGVKVVRLKNYFGKLDATHYRRLQCVVKVSVRLPGQDCASADGFYHLAEVQIQLASIFHFRNDNYDICRKPFEYFRAIIPKKKEMNTALEDGQGGGWMSLDDTLLAWAGFLQTPVVLATFVLVLSRLDFGSPGTLRLPNDKLALYGQAVGIMVDEAAGVLAARCATTGVGGVDATQRRTNIAQTIMEMLQVVACHNQLLHKEGGRAALRRLFSERNVEEVLAEHPSKARLLGVFKSLLTSSAGDDADVGEYSVPAFKVLASGSAEGAMLQATHLSFQEYLAGRQLVADVSLWEKAIEDDAALYGICRQQGNMLSLLTAEEMVPLLNAAIQRGTTADNTVALSKRGSSLLIQACLQHIEDDLDGSDCPALADGSSSNPRWAALHDVLRHFFERQLLLAKEDPGSLRSKCAKLSGDSAGMYEHTMKDVRRTDGFDTHCDLMANLAHRIESRIRGQGEAMEMCRWRDVAGKSPMPLQRRNDILAIHAAGATVLPRFVALLQDITAGISGCSFKAMPRKKLWQSLEKCGLSKDPAQSLREGAKVIDVVRGTAEMEHFQGGTSFLNYLLGCDPREAEEGSRFGSVGFADKHGRIVFVSVKNRWKNPATGGWCCGQIYFYFEDDPNQHICELQVVHTQMQMARKRIPIQSYEIHSQTRCFQELLSVVGGKVGVQQKGPTAKQSAGVVADEASFGLRL